MSSIHPAMPLLLFVAMVAVRLRPVPRRWHSDVIPSRSYAWRARLEHLRWRQRARCGPGEVAQWLDSVAREVRSGANLSAAIDTIEPPPALSATVAPARRALRRGASLVSALDEVAGDDPQIRLSMTVLRALAVHGGPAAEPIDRAAATLRARAAIDAERVTQSAQARLSALVMTLLPIAMLVLLIGASSSVRRVVTAPLGVVIIALGAALNLVGWWWMRRIVNGTPT